jgi:DNA polymerase III epsilon subunit-like protein
MNLKSQLKHLTSLLLKTMATGSHPLNFTIIHLACTLFESDKLAECTFESGYDPAHVHSTYCCAILFPTVIATGVSCMPLTQQANKKTHSPSCPQSL